jgi:hypothetical protein
MSIDYQRFAETAIILATRDSFVPAMSWMELRRVTTMAQRGSCALFS